MAITAAIKEKALTLGFDFVGVASVGALEHDHAYKQWIEQGYHGEMGWLARDPERRIDPERVLPGVRSVVVVGWSYFVQHPPSAIWDDPSRGRIARYAWGPDYHDLITPKVADLAAFIREEVGRDTGDALLCGYRSGVGTSMGGSSGCRVYW